MDKLVGRACKYGYTTKRYSIKDILSGDKKLWDRVTSDANNSLQELLPNTLQDHFNQEVTIINYL